MFFDPTQAIFVDHSVYELKALISTAIESQEDKNVIFNVFVYEYFILYNKYDLAE